MSEKRHYTRVSYHKRVTIINMAGEECIAELSNLCLKGAFVTIKEGFDFAVGDEITLRISLSEEDDCLIEGAAKFVWKNDYQGYGLFFLHMPLESFNHLKRLVELNFHNAETIQHELENLIKSCD